MKTKWGKKQRQTNKQSDKKRNEHKKKYIIKHDFYKTLEVYHSILVLNAQTKAWNHKNSCWRHASALSITHWSIQNTEAEKNGSTTTNYSKQIAMAFVLAKKGRLFRWSKHSLLDLARQLSYNHRLCTGCAATIAGKKTKNEICAISLSESHRTFHM